MISGPTPSHPTPVLEQLPPVDLRPCGDEARLPDRKTPADDLDVVDRQILQRRSVNRRGNGADGVEHQPPQTVFRSVRCPGRGNAFSARLELPGDPDPRTPRPGPRTPPSPHVSCGRPASEVCPSCFPDRSWETPFRRNDC